MNTKFYENNILEVINSIDVEEYSADGIEVEYILIEDNTINRVILDTVCIISQSDFDIEDNIINEYIDVSLLGFKFSSYWDKHNGFNNKGIKGYIYRE